MDDTSLSVQPPLMDKVTLWTENRYRMGLLWNKERKRGAGRKVSSFWLGSIDLIYLANLSLLTHSLVTERVQHPFVLQCDNSHSRSELTFLSSPLWSDDHAGGRSGDINLTVHYAAPLQNSLSPFPFPLTALQNGGDRGGGHSAQLTGRARRSAMHPMFCSATWSISAHLRT